jgi:TPR repeat protein
MRISDALGLGIVLAAVLAVPATAPALDPQRAPAAVPAPTPLQAFRSGTQLYIAGEKVKAFSDLRFAAEQGHPMALWKIGRMYAHGDGIKRDDLKAFEYFSRLASENSEESPFTPQARFVASAFVALGSYYLAGIPNTPVRSDTVRARDMFNYAASYFGDSDAQYQLARLYLEGVGVNKDPRQALRWLSSAAHKGQYQAQALLGQMLFRGEDIPRQGAQGLMWLTLARDAAAGPDDKWIVDTHEEASMQATADERALALIYLKRWLKGQR